MANKTHPKLIGEKKISGEIWILIVSIIVALGCNHWIASILGSLNYHSCVLLMNTLQSENILEFKGNTEYIFQSNFAPWKSWL